jgi:Flp pilus assembly pilin Flp
MKQLLSNEKGQGIVEYGLIIMVVALVVIVGISMVTERTNAFFTSAGELFE